MKQSNDSNLNDDKFDPFAPIDYPVLPVTYNTSKSETSSTYFEDNNAFSDWEEPDNSNNESPYCWYVNEIHFYLKVPLAHIEEIGVVELISPYSYVENDHIYLEEDGDAYHFIDALKASGKEFNPKRIVVNDLSFLNGLYSFGCEEETYYSHNDINHPDLISFKDDIITPPVENITPESPINDLPDWK